MTGYQLAHLKIAAMREPLESPSMADFVANGATARAFTFKDAFPPPRPDGT